MKAIERAAMNTAKSKLSAKAMERRRRIEELRKLLPPGSTVYTVVKHVARSGMMRRILPIAIVQGEAQSIAAAVSDVLDWKWTDDGAVQVSGCGMDMTFHLVYELAQALHGDGYKLNNKNL